MRESLSEVVAGNVRAELARQNIPTRAVAAAISRSPAATRKRLNGEISLDVQELAQIAELLGVEPIALFPRMGGDEGPEPPDQPAAAAAVRVAVA